MFKLVSIYQSLHHMENTEISMQSIIIQSYINIYLQVSL